MTEKRLDMENGTIRYRIEKDRAVITGFQGFAANLALPAQIEGCAVAAVDRKAFLSRKSLCTIVMPDSVEEVGDWAFAHCDSLREVSFPGRQVRFGRAVFKDCSSLGRIAVRGKAAFCAELLAAAVTMMDAYYLLNLCGAAGNGWSSGISGCFPSCGLRTRKGISASPFTVRRTTSARILRNSPMPGEKSRCGWRSCGSFIPVAWIPP